MKEIALPGPNDEQGYQAYPRRINLAQPARRARNA
jgi:hypothetical protein